MRIDMTLSGTNRRKFLKQTLFVSAAAVTTPYFVPRHVLGFAGTPGANEQIVVGVIGVGVRGKQLIRNIKNLPGKGRVAAICDCDARKVAETLQEHHADWKTYEDYRRLIDQKDLDGVMICTPHHQHVLPAMLACQAGLDVYVEKPLSNYVNEGRALVKAARKYGRVVQTGSQQRTMEMNRFACELVRDGGIGKVKVVEAVCFGGPMLYPKEGLPEEPIPAGFNWDLFQVLRQFIRTIGFSRRIGRRNSAVAGPIGATIRATGTDMMAHSLDMVQYAMGADESGPVEFWPVEGKGRSARIDFRYANGIRCNRSTRLTRSRNVGRCWAASSLGIVVRSRSTATSSRPIRRTSCRIRPTRSWRKSGKATGGSPRATSRTGLTASSRGPNPRPTWRSAIAR